MVMPLPLGLALTDGNVDLIHPPFDTDTVRHSDTVTVYRAIATGCLVTTGNSLSHCSGHVMNSANGNGETVYKYNDVFAATSIVTLYVTVKVQSMQRACASLATSCQRCSDSFISKLNTRAVVISVRLSAKNPSTAKLEASTLLGFVCLKVKYPSSDRIRPSQR